MPIESSFNGSIEEIPFIYVDNFTNHYKKAYFLSHYHADHTVGLQSRLRYSLKKNNAFIYASEVTIAIIKADISDLEPYLRVLELGKNTISIKFDDEEIFLNITTAPAGHCFGSIMFIFHHNQQNIMYTGDFRISRNDVSKFKSFHDSNGQPLLLQTMYVDTTFQHATGFPKRSEVATNIVMHIKNWLSRSEENTVILFTSANYGYESIFNEIFKVTGMKTCVEEKWKVYSQFPKELYGITNNKNESRISTYSKNAANYMKIPKTCLKVYLSAWIWQNNVSEDDFFTITDDGQTIKACFATHCGREELVYFINYFQPDKIVGFREPFIQNESAENSEVNRECNNMVLKRKRVKCSDNVVQKVPKSVLEKAFDW